MGLQDRCPHIPLCDKIKSNIHVTLCTIRYWDASIYCISRKDNISPTAPSTDNKLFFYTTSKGDAQTDFPVKKVNVHFMGNANLINFLKQKKAKIFLLIYELIGKK